MHKDEKISIIWFSPSNELIADVLLRDLDLDSITIVRILCIVAKFEREYLENGDIFRHIPIAIKYVDLPYLNFTLNKSEGQCQGFPQLLWNRES